MELNQNFTKPAVRSVLSFTEKELINALQEYAEQNGYSFSKNSEYTIWHPNQRGSGEYLTKLVVDIDGNNGAILEGQNKDIIRRCRNCTYRHTICKIYQVTPACNCNEYKEQKND